MALIEDGSGSGEGAGDESDEDGGELHVCWLFGLEVVVWKRRVD